MDSENLKEEFEKYDFYQKLVQIAKYEDILLSNENIMRMRGSLSGSHAQTYSIFDNSQFRIAKDIYYELQKELENE